MVVGSFNVDVTCFAPKLPRHGETVSGSFVQMSAGGKGFNQAAAASRSGGNVKMVARIGKDELTQMAHDCFKKFHVSEKYVREVEGKNTGSAFIEVDETNGENRIIVVKGANGALTDKDVYEAEEDFKDCDIIITQLETEIETVKAAAELAEKFGKQIILNPAPCKELPPEILRKVDFFTPNETEAEFYSGVHIENEEDAKRAAEKIMQLGVKNVIITLGKKGAYYKTADEDGLVPSITVKAVDTTGAGDAFNGALAVAISEGKDIKSAIEYATVYAAVSVTRKGACESMPEREEAEDFMMRFR